MRSATIQTRIDADTKVRARNILDSLGISMSEAIMLYLHQIVLRGGIPFEIKLPNRATLAAVQALESEKGLHTVSNSDELIQELHS